MQQHKEKPILCNAEMVNAVLSGRKTQTRRVIKLPDCVVLDFPSLTIDMVKTSEGLFVKARDDMHFMPALWIKCPYGQVGDRLWVRETTCISPKNWAIPDNTCRLDKEGYARYVSYKADGHSEDAMRDYKLKWTPSIHVPRWASRINLDVTDIRIERVQDITEEDVRREGIALHSESPAHYKDYDVCLRAFNRRLTPKESFYTLWDSINEKRGYGWDINPWVWVVEFKLIKDI